MTLAEDTTFEQEAEVEHQRRLELEEHRSFDKPFKVHATQGQGDMIWNSFDTLEQALAEVEEHKGSASFGVEYPDGRWHNWGNGVLCN